MRTFYVILSESRRQFLQKKPAKITGRCLLLKTLVVHIAYFAVPFKI